LTGGFLKPPGGSFQLVRVGCGENRSEAPLHYFHNGRRNVGIRRANPFLDTPVPWKTRVRISVSRRVIALARHSFGRVADGPLAR
jgi:hypothetical protein